MIRVKETTLIDVLEITLLDCFEDHRGEYVETYNEKIYFDAGIDVKFVQDDYSISERHVLRGLHGDAKTWKLISCPVGKFYLVVVNCDSASPAFGKWESFLLSEKLKKQVLIPPMYGNGHLVLSNYAMFHYKQSEYYDPETQFTYRWDDPAFGIWWPVKNPIQSRRDEMGEYVGL
ncbi:MAG: dTDP-4-dehydrorhamnose 3,5-epimerase [Pseudomonadota bacterium]